MLPASLTFSSKPLLNTIHESADGYVAWAMRTMGRSVGPIRQDISCIMADFPPEIQGMLV